MDLSAYKGLKVGGITLKELKINGVLAWKSGPTNWVPLSINADGTPYNGGLGYKGGYRIRSGGAEGGHENGSCTGYIPVKGGDVVRMYPIDSTLLSVSGTAINVSDSSFTNLGQAASNGAYGIFTSSYSAYSWGNAAVSEGGGVYRWPVPPAASGVAYIRVSLYNGKTGGPGASMIVTINEEI